MIQAIENQHAQINAKKDKRGNCNSENTFSNLLKNTVDNKNKTLKSADTEKALKSKVPTQDVDDAAKNLTAPPQDGRTAAIAMQMIPNLVLAEKVMNFSNPAKAADEFMKVQTDLPIDVQTQFNAAKFIASAQSEFAVQNTQIPQMTMNAEIEGITLFQKQDDAQASILSDVGIGAMQNTDIDFDVQIISENTLMAKETDKKPVQGLNIEIQKNTDAEMKNTSLDVSGRASEDLPIEKKTSGSETENADMLLLENQVEKFGLKTIKVSDEASEIKRPVIHQVAEKVLVNMKKDVSEFKMQLHPKDLGEISVKMITKNGVLTVELSAVNNKTQDLLNANADKIRAVLESSQQKEVHINCTQQEHETYANLQEHSSESGRQQQEQQNHASQKDDEKLIMTDNFLSFLEMMERKAV